MLQYTRRNEHRPILDLISVWFRGELGSIMMPEDASDNRVMCAIPWRSGENLVMECLECFKAAQGNQLTVF